MTKKAVSYLKEEKNTSQLKNSWSSKDKVESGEYVLRRSPKKTEGKEVDDADAATTIPQISDTTLAYITKTTTNSLKDAKTSPLTVSAASSMWVGQVQTVSKCCKNNKVPNSV